MKKIYYILFLALAGCATQRSVYLFTSFHEPANEGLRLLYSYDGYKWTDAGKNLLKPEVGSQKVMRDPSIVQGPDKIFRLVWTSSWKEDKGFGYAYSNDLIHWSKQQFIPVMEQEPNTVNVWAPELFFDNDTKQYIIVWASTIPGRFEKGQESDSNNHRLYYTVTKDFNTFSPAKLLWDPGFSVIDATIVKEAAGKYVLVLKDNTRPNRDIRVAFSAAALGPYSELSTPFTRPFTEGPSAVKVKNDWLIYYDAYRDGKYGAMRTRDFKTFETIDSLVSIPAGHKHGTIFKTNRKILKKILDTN